MRCDLMICVCLLWILTCVDGQEMPSYYELLCKNEIERNSSRSLLGRYVRYDEIMKWMDDLCCLYPEIAQIYDIGKTSEGRSMIVLQLGYRRSPDAWSIWIDGGIHAREHIAPATVIYIANEMVEGYRSKDPVVLDMLQKINWFFLPVFNPDGYEYSHTKSRLWRKNRRRISKMCVGVDLNRNWDIEWGAAGKDDEPCSELYAGDGPASEPEIRNTVDFLLPRASEFIVFLTYHSFGQRIYSRWDYSKHQFPSDHEELTNLAQKVSDAIAEVHGRDYKVGQSTKLLHVFSGGSADWAKANAGIKYSYLIELRDTGLYGFQLPETEILPTGSENWAGVQAIASHIIKNHAPRNASKHSPGGDRRNSTKHSQGGDRILPRRRSNPRVSMFVDPENSSTSKRNGLSAHPSVTVIFIAVSLIFRNCIFVDNGDWTRT